MPTSVVITVTASPLMRNLFRQRVIRFFAVPNLYRASMRWALSQVTQFQASLCASQNRPIFSPESW